MNGPLASLYKPPPKPQPPKPLFEGKAQLRARLAGLKHFSDSQQAIIDDLRQSLHKHKGMLADARRMLDDMRSNDAYLQAQLSALAETQSPKAASALSCRQETHSPASAEQSEQQSPKVSE